MSGIKTLVSAAGARSLDREAQEQWGLDAFALVEAAGRACAEVFVKNIIGEKREALSFAVFAGSGNNAADALVMLKALLLRGYAEPSACAVFCTRLPEGERNPFGEAVLAIRRLGVAVNAWEAETTFAPNAPAPNAPAHTALARACFIIDGITGTGLSAPLHGTALEMAQAINNALQGRVISIDLPSGNFDLWQPGMPAVQADITLAIEPQKLCLYAPSARPLAGKILPVEGIFPPALMAKYGEAELAVWEGASARIPPVPETAHKYTRGLVEIKAGSPGATGAAVLAALGAQAAGAGLVRLIVDPAVYPVVAPACSGVMAVPGGAAGDGRFHPAAVLLGPGWGRGEDRM
ncbi:MAG: hypothetical protein FWH41_02750, partial [Treponema sp.]|nr:hypothetical protein [Treponema sp.]